MDAERLRKRIAAAGLTQGRLARLTGMSANSLSRKLSGKRDFRLEEMRAICAALEIDDPTPYFFETGISNTQQRNERARGRGGPGGPAGAPGTRGEAPGGRSA